MTPRLTIAIRRGLRHVVRLATSDLDADQSTSGPQFTAREAAEIRRALRWISHKSASNAKDKS